MTTSKFEELEIYQLAEKLSDRFGKLLLNGNLFHVEQLVFNMLMQAIALELILLKVMVKEVLQIDQDLRKSQEVPYLKQDIGQINPIAEN